MFWVGLLLGLVVGASAGVALYCVLVARRNYDMCEVLDECRRELSRFGYESARALCACERARLVLNENGWRTAEVV